MGSIPVPLLDLVQALRGDAPARASESCAELLQRFEPLFRKHWFKIRMTVQPTGISYEDFVQEIAARMIKYLPSLENPRAFPGYLQSIVATTTVELLRTARRQISDEALRDMISDVYTETTDALVIRAYLDKLPVEEAYLLEMNIVQGIGIGACSKRLNLSEGAVKALKSRAIRRLRKIVKGEEMEITKL